MNSILKPQESDNKFSQAFWTYTGAFLLAVILIVLVHEVGHYLAFRWRGYDAVVRINPFMGTTSSQHEVQPQDFIYILLGGPVFDLSVAAAAAILLRFVKNAHWILLKMYAAMAFLIEGMVLIAGLFFDETVTDFSWLISLGLKPIFVGLLGAVLIIIGGLLNYEIWHLVGITPESPRRQVLLLNSAFLVYILGGFAIGLAIMPIELKFFRNFLAVALVLHSLYLVLRVFLNPYLMPSIQRRTHRNYSQATANLGRLSMVLGGTSWVISFLVLN